MPESRWIAHSVRNPNPSFATVTWPEYPPSKYFASTSAMRVLTRSRKASPMSRFFPDMRNDIVRLRSSRCSGLLLRYEERRPASTRPSGLGAGERLLLAPALHRGRDAHRFAVFCNRSPRNVDAGLAQPFHDGIVGQHLGGTFGFDQLFDAVAHRFGRMGFAAVGGRYRRGK